MAVLLFIIVVIWIVSVADGIGIAANDKRKGREAFEEAKRNTQKKMDAWAKEQNVYYTGWMTLTDHKRNYDGTPKE